MKPNEIEGYLNANGIYPDNIYTSDDMIDITICDGDWKHDHGRCRYLMEKAGYVRESLNIIDGGDDDCFSAVHIYTKSEI